LRKLKRGVVLAKKASKVNGTEPFLGGSRAIKITGLEPSMSHQFDSRYGPFHIRGLEAPPVEGRRKPLVVLAEFDDSTAELVCLLAESNGYDVRRTDDGSQAELMVKALEPDLIVTGLKLITTEGLALIGRIRALHDRLLARRPILVMDVRHGAPIVLKAFEQGADDYVELPCELPTMLKAWRRTAGTIRRPSPLSALLNDNDAVRNAALSFLINTQPEGLEDGLGELLWQPNPAVRSTIRWALQRIDSAEANALLAKLPWGQEEI